MKNAKMHRTTTNRNALEFESSWARGPLLQRYDVISRSLNQPHDSVDILKAFKAWEQVRRDVASWKGVAEIRMRQNTNDIAANQQHAAFASASPQFETRDSEIKRLILESPHRDVLASHVGPFIFKRWEFDLCGSDPRMHPYLEDQSRLGTRYTRILATMQFSLHGRPFTQPELTTLQKHPNRALRREALFEKWASFEACSEELDDIFDALVRSRTSMAQALNESSFIGLAYRRLGRIDYAVSDVRKLREEIHEAIVPLAARLVAEQEQQLGIEALMPWDESLYEASPQTPIDVPIEHIMHGLKCAYESTSAEIANFWQELTHRSLMDVYDRPGKALGAFCEYLPHIGMPFVFANASGAPRNALTIAHETGHAFQLYSSQHYKAMDLIIPANETGEIHSLSLEFLLWPHFDSILSCGVEEFRRTHLRSMLMMLPYIAAIDHFQEAVYERPEASVKDRRSIWLEMEAFYMPWRKHGDIPALLRGGPWQAQRHVYRFPFYYIDYAIALCCALQIWQESRVHYEVAVERYLDLCKLGGSLPFRQILMRAGIMSPFERGTLARAAVEAASYLL